MIDAIRAAFGGDDPSKARVIAKSEVLKWMSEPDLEVRGALYSKLSNALCAKHIQPPLQFDDYFGFVVPYLEQCIEQNPDGQWTDSRYLAGHQLVAWINKFWSDSSVPRSRLAEIRERLAKLYRRGDADVRDGVINGVLEHLFENRQVAAFFQEWERDPDLSKAYKDARLWSEKM